MADLDSSAPRPWTIIDIGGREAVPLRALPYVFPAMADPRRLIDELTHFTTVSHADDDLVLIICDNLGPKGKVREGTLKGVFAYHLQGGQLTKIEPNDWHRIGRPITVLPKKENRVGQDYSDETALLPAGVFVRRDELPINEDSYSPWIPENMRSIVMEGFDSPLEQPSAPAPKAALPPADKPLDARERTTLLAIIEALARNARINTTRHEAAGVTIAKPVDQIGAKVDSGTIARHLKKIPDALEAKAK